MIKRIIRLISVVLPLAACSYGLTENTYEVIPLPQELTPQKGMFTLNKKTQLCVADPSAAPLAGMFAQQIECVGGLTLVQHNDVSVQKNVIVFDSSSDASLGQEGYSLEIRPKKIVVKANAPNGFFYAVQTLMQLMPEEIYSRTKKEGVNWSIPAADIRDFPRFAYRGLHLDVCRHFFPVEFIKKYIDLLAMQKMNRFHWHLTDDQGWRIEIKKYPRLMLMGSQRRRTLEGAYKTPFVFDNTPYGGFYTQDEIREVVAYAQERYVTVIPEVELPGHALAALTSYPDLGCTGGPYEVQGLWGVFEDVFCAGNDQVFRFLEDVFTEVIDLFPSEYIHIGGDECPKTRWEKCPKCRARMRQEKLKNTHELQSYFVHRIENFLNSKGRQIIGWDEILEGGLAPNATVMSWRGVEGGIAAASAGHNAIMAPNSHCYLDYYQVKERETEPLAIGGFIPLDKVYSFEPVPDTLAAAGQGKHILGPQGNVWTEYIKTPDHVEYMAYPRANALAEVGWSAKEDRSWEDYLLRLQKQFKRWDYYGVNAATHFRE